MTAPKPNVVVIFCDAPGYGDLGSYGSPNIRTHPGELYDLRADLAQKQNLYGKERKEPDKVKELQGPSALTVNNFMKRLFIFALLAFVGDFALVGDRAVGATDTVGMKGTQITR